MKPAAVFVVATLTALAAFVPAASAQAPQTPAREPDASDLFFKKGEIPRFKIEIAPEDLEKLRADGRAYVRATLRENEKTIHPDVALKLKGAAGSYREVDDKPGFTVDANKFRRGQSYRGLEKFHLNNAIQDETYLHELLASDLFRAAGIPATRVSHARVWLNGRDLGLYVFKEAFDREFLERSFAKGGGDLYDGGFCQDVDADLQKDAGDDPEDRGELKALLAAARQPEAKARSDALAARLDVPAFLTFWAMERMIAHWDGYCQNRNNYRLYFDPTGGKAVFLPHGMDQIFEEADAPILDHPSALVAAAVDRDPALRARFRKRVVELLPLFNAEKLAKRVDDVAARLRPVLEAISDEAARNHAERVRTLKERLSARAKNLKEQSVMPDPKPVVFDKASMFAPKKWRPASECDDAKLSDGKVAGERVLKIACGRSGKCIAGFRTNVLLAKGRYKLVASVQTEGVVSLAGEAGGATLRLSGDEKPPARVDGTVSWKPVECVFEVTEEEKDVELVAELRCSKGQALFRADSLKVVRLK
jgi:spore coat protein H